MTTSTTTPLIRLQELVVDVELSAAEAAASVRSELPDLSPTVIIDQLTGVTSLDRQISDALARNHGLRLAEDWLYDFLTADDVEDRGVSHIRTVRRLIGAGATWRRIVRDQK